MIFPARGHVFKFWAENTSALSWMENTARDTNPIVRCLIRFRMAILVASGIPCILQGQHTPGKENVEAGRLSRPTLEPSWESIMVECPAVKLFWPCQVPPTLLSTLALAISVGSIESSVAKEMIRLWTRELLTSHTG
jgi:hypothetical protein